MLKKYKTLFQVSVFVHIELLVLLVKIASVQNCREEQTNVSSLMSASHSSRDHSQKYKALHKFIFCVQIWSKFLSRYKKKMSSLWKMRYVNSPNAHVVPP